MVVATQNAFVNITKGLKNLNSTIVYKATIRGPSMSPSNIKYNDFCNKNYQLPGANYCIYSAPVILLGRLSWSCAKLKPPVEVNVIEKYVLRENTKE